MRLTISQIDFIRHLIAQLAGDCAQFRVFGSCLNDTAKGGDLDLLLKTDNKTRSRIQFLARVVAKARDHLLVTDQRLFHQSFSMLDEMQRRLDREG